MKTSGIQSPAFSTDCSGESYEGKVLNLLDKIAHFLTRKPKLILAVAVGLLVPAIIGSVATRINYDILTYLPQNLESSQGEKLLEEPFHDAATTMLIVEDMPAAYTNDLLNSIKEIPGVNNAVWVSNLVGIQVPTDFLPDSLRQTFYSGDSTMEYETKNSDDQSGVEDASKVECYQLGEQIFGYLFHALQKGVAEGTLQAGLDSEAAALVLWACTVGIYNTGEKKGDYLKKYHQIDPQNFVTESFHLMMRLIGRKGVSSDENKLDF